MSASSRPTISSESVNAANIENLPLEKEGFMRLLKLSTPLKFDKEELPTYAICTTSKFDTIIRILFSEKILTI